MRYVVTFFLIVILLSGCTTEETETNIEVGAIAPDFCVKDLDGNIVILSNFKEEPVILRFWETDCRFCRADTPIINVYFEKYKDRGLKVFYISASTENKEAVTDFIKDLEVPFPVIMDDDAIIADLYNILLYPQTLIIAPGQKILAIIPGGVGEADLDELIGPFLQDAETDLPKS
jgi:peroxiredoxin